MIYFPLFKAIPADASDQTFAPKSIGLQYSQDGLQFLKDIHASEIEFYAACINTNNAYVKHQQPITDATISDKIDIDVCTESGINMTREFGLPAYGTIAIAYSTIYGQRVKVGECKLVDDFGGILTIQNCSGNETLKTSLTVSFTPEAQEALKDLKDKTMQLSAYCGSEYSTDIFDVSLADMSVPIATDALCSDKWGLRSIHYDDELGNLDINTATHEHKTFIPLDDGKYVACLSRRHVPTYDYVIYSCGPYEPFL